MSKELDLKPAPTTLDQDTLLVDRSEEPERRLTPMLPFDLGEQIVGSNHRFPVGRPVNLSRHAGALLISLSGDPAMSAVRLEPQILVPREPSAPIELAYTPTVAGESRSKLLVTARWDDGHEEQQAISVSARARMLEGAPEATTRNSDPNHAVGNGNPVIAPAPSADPEIGALNDASQLAAGALTAVFEMQQIGVTNVQKDQANFTTAREEPSIWWDLAEIALAMGTAGLGKLVESAVTGRVEHFLEERDAAGKALHEAAGVAKTTHHAASEGTKLSAEVVATAAADGFKAAFEHGKELGAKLRPEQKEEGADQAPAESPGDSVDFFSHQQEVLVNAKQAAMAEHVSLRASLRPIARTNPVGAAAAMNAITFGYNQISKTAIDIQGRATAAEFAAFKARSNLGEETVQTSSGTRTATDLSNTRDPFHDSHGFHSALAADGLLDIDVEIRGDSVRVTGARVTGIAQRVADRLVRVDLLTAGVPVRIKTNGLFGDITRDEVGRVRCSALGRSFEGESESPEPEAQRLRGAERVLLAVLGKRLVDWGVERINTNDASARSEGRTK